jgi:hypothetical protein
MSLVCDLEPKMFQGLLTGLGKKNFYDEPITLDFLREQLFGAINLTPEGKKLATSCFEDHSSLPRTLGALLQISEFERVLLQAANENW